MKLSKSKINTYLKCPLEFKFQYIDEIEAEPNKYMVLGSDVHSVAETFADKFGDELDEENRFSGICDIILEDENGDLVVIDYKTSSSNSFHKYRRELCYYKLLVENVYNRDVSSVGIFFTRNGRLRLLDVCDEDNKRKYLNDAEISQAVDTLHYVRKQINNENFPAKRQFLCKYCTYRHICGVY